MSDTYQEKSQDDIAQALADLLPRGRAWPRDPNSTLMKAIEGLAGPWADVASYADNFLEVESFPTSTLNMLPDWEKSFGLPDPCVSEPLTIPDRRAALIQRMTQQGAQDRQFFIDLAASIGYAITITEYSPFACGISAVGNTKYVPGVDGQPAYYVPGITFDDPENYRWQIGSPGIRYYWTVSVSTLRLSYFYCGAGQCGVDPLLRIGLATDLQCLLNRWKPAHTEIIFNYSSVIYDLDFYYPFNSMYYALGVV